MHITEGGISLTTKTSIITLTLVDHNYKFLVVDVSPYGKDGDAGTFAKSPLGNILSEAFKFH
jgi:hypothetical protein